MADKLQQFSSTLYMPSGNGDIIEIFAPLS